MTRETNLDLEVLTPAVGAVLGGIDLTRPLDPDLAKAIRHAVLDHGVVFMRDQDLSQEQMASFMTNFGRLCPDPFSREALKPPPEKDTVRFMPTYNNRKATAVWHIDSTVAAQPASFIALRAIEMPPGGGGDTCWGSMYAAYETLSEPLRTLLDSLTAEHSAWRVMPLLGGALRGDLQETMRNTHPVIRIHPETGRKALFVNALWTEKIVELSQFESDRLLAMLHEHAASPEFTVRWRWRMNDIALWDNRAFQHYAVMDYDGTRVLQKSIVAGDRPYGPPLRAERQPS